MLLAGFAALRASLPELDGSLPAAGLGARAVIERDANGVPTVTAADRRDLAWATGFVHASDRWFQMDLTRRRAAGELAALVGPAAVALDRRVRWHRLRSRARAVLERLDPGEARLIEAYTAGANAGLAALGARPFEYYLLRAAPEPWRAEDTVLAVYAMFLQLHDARGVRDTQRGLAWRALPPSVYASLYPRGSLWDAPLVGGPVAPPPLPEAAEFSLARGVPGSARGAGRDAVDRIGRDAGGVRAELPVAGSNNWAVAGRHTAGGRALLANDMHLGLAVPNVFYRARLRIAGEDGIDLAGVTLPGAPVLVAGSNGRIAWGYTNSQGDWTDVIALRPGSGPGTYLTPEGERAYREFVERIEVRGAAPVELPVRETIWGPVLDDVALPGSELAVAWTAHRPDAIDLGLIGLERAGNVPEALAIAARTGIPPQNFTVADAAGSIGWTVIGRMPLRGDAEPRRPDDWSRPGRAWRGWVAPEDYPRIVDPPGGRIWTANARTVDGEWLELIGDGDYALGARARQIRNALRELELARPADMLAIQLDDRALFFARWRRLLLALLDGDALAGRAGRTEFRALLADWIPRASVEAVGYRLVRSFRRRVLEYTFGALSAPVYAAYGEQLTLLASRQYEATLWRLVTERPPHLLPPGHDDWRAFLLAAVDEVVAGLSAGAAEPGALGSRTWGERNTARIRHPLSPALPWPVTWPMTWLAGGLDMPPDPLPGDVHLPRVQTPSFGASERFAVAPGAESEGYFHMPGGQSGHPLSPWYRNGHAAWVAGRATPFLPGETRYRLALEPTGP